MGTLEKRVIDLAHKHKLSHISSCLTSVGIIDKIYQVKKQDEPFILSNGHAALALYAVLEKWRFTNADKLVEKHGVHPNRDIDEGIYASTGSLGHGLGIAVGMAMANPKRNVYVLMSDGECAEGSVWEALRIASENHIENLRITVNCNGWSAMKRVDVETLDIRLQYFYPTLCIKSNMYSFPEWLQGLQGHYTVLTDAQYEQVKNL